MSNMHRTGTFVRNIAIGGAVGCVAALLILVVGGAALYLLRSQSTPPQPPVAAAPTIAFASPQPTPAPAPTTAPTLKPPAPAPTTAPITAPIVLQGNFPDASGQSRTILMGVTADAHNAFFQALGSNDRTCVTCHEPSDGWTISPAHIRARYDASQGKDPLFLPADGANSPKADVSTLEARRTAYSLLLNKGLIRVELAVPANTEFHLMTAEDPYGYASDKGLSLFRRVPPTSNLYFLTSVMWDGRETAPNLSLDQQLMNQANDAALTFSQAAHPLTSDQLSQILTFEKGIYSTQVYDNSAGNFYEENGHAGPEWLAIVKFVPGINDPFGANANKTPFDPLVFDIFDPWMNMNMNGASDPHMASRISIARGEQVFNTKKFNISGVKGLNDDLGKAVIQGTCTTCHNSPDVGNHSTAMLLDIGISDVSRRTPDLPLYTLMNDATHDIIQTTDPGRALVTGKWKDMNKFKAPVLRDLAARAPYFHNGSAATLMDVVSFYNTRFSMGLTQQEKQDLANFLSGL